MPETNVGGRDRLARALLAVLLTTVAVGTIGSGKHNIGLLALAGALGLGFNRVTGFCARGVRCRHEHRVAVVRDTRLFVVCEGVIPESVIAPDARGRPRGDERDAARMFDR